MRGTAISLLSTLVLAACCLAAHTLPPATAADRPALRLFAAASLANAADEVARAWTGQTGIAVTSVFAGSAALARQIEAGAPADLYISANPDWMDHLAASGHVTADSRRDLLGNRLVVIAPAPAAMGDGRPADALRYRLGETGRLAIAETTAVPAGRYARAALERLGLWQDLAPRLAEAENVRAALLYVSRGEAPVGIVYATDARIDPGVAVVAAIPEGLHPPIVYPAARIEASTHPAASAFLDHLASPEAAAIFRRHGFEPLASAAPG